MITIECLNRQKKRRLGRNLTDALRVLASRTLERLGVGQADITIALVSDRKIHELNRRYRGTDRPTDVLSFAYHEPAGSSPPLSQAGGDVVISVETAARQAKLHRLTLSKEIEMLALHGVLHLCGYDHEQDHGEMNRLERKLRKALLEPPRSSPPLSGPGHEHES